MPRVLHLTLKKWPFGMIAADIKKEEYRELSKYWLVRFKMGAKTSVTQGEFKQFDIVRFKNGYCKNCPEVDVEWNGIDIGIGKHEWGASGREQFIIKLGKILSIKNYNKT